MLQRLSSRSLFFSSLSHDISFGPGRCAAYPSDTVRSHQLPGGASMAHAPPGDEAPTYQSTAHHQAGTERSGQGDHGISSDAGEAEHPPTRPRVNVVAAITISIYTWLHEKRFLAFYC